MLKIIPRISRSFAGLAGWLAVPMMLSVCLDALLRGGFNIAMQGVVEINSLILVMMIYLGLAGAQNSRANFNVTLFIDPLSPRIKRIISVVLNLIAILAIGTLCICCWKVGLSSYARGESTYGLFKMPIWTGRLVVAFGISLLVLQLIADLFSRDAQPESGVDDASPPPSAL